MKKVKRLWFTDDRIFIETENNNVQSQLLQFSPDCERQTIRNEPTGTNRISAYIGIRLTKI